MKTIQISLMDLVSFRNKKSHAKKPVYHKNLCMIFRSSTPFTYSFIYTKSKYLYHERKKKTSVRSSLLHKYIQLCIVSN